MDIEYKLTEYFEKNNLFDSETANGITVNVSANSLVIKGTSRDLIEFADLLCNMAKTKDKDAHIHIDNLTLLNKESDFSEIIIEKATEK